MAKNCINIQQSLGWCQGTPVLPGIKSRAYFISKDKIVKWPTLPKDENGRVTGATYEGQFELVADAVWHYIDFIATKSQLKSDPQGEQPSQTQKNDLTLVHPGVDEDAAAATAYLNNSDNVFIVEDMTGKFRVVGSPYYESTTTVAQDNGQGATGTASTTITVSASDIVAAPFYTGPIVTEDGTINEE